MISFPTLEALAIINCRNDDIFFLCLDAKKFPNLAALLLRHNGNTQRVPGLFI